MQKLAIVGLCIDMQDGVVLLLAEDGEIYALFEPNIVDFVAVVNDKDDEAQFYIASFNKTQSIEGEVTWQLKRTK